MKGRSIFIFFLILALIAGAYFVTVKGVKIGDFQIKPITEKLKLGLDIKGGVVVVYEAKTNENMDIAIGQTIKLLSRRINELGLTEPSITRQGQDRIRIELPGVDSASEALEVIGKTAKLEFLLVNEGMALEGMKKSDFKHESVLTGKHVSNAGIDTNEYGAAVVSLKFDKEGTELFAEGTRRSSKKENSNGQIAIVLDGEVISAPMADEPINAGMAVIRGNFTMESASNLAMLIRGGALPVELEEAYSSEIGPTLGLNSLKSAIKAGIIGIIAVAIFMALMYKVPGIIASIALSLYALIIIYAMIGLNATLTLPGIAGIVISLGMAVDANVIIFERVREELSNGKSLRASIRSGFSRGMSTIIDSNVTTLVAAVVLFFFGDGAIKGFAVTLTLGIVASMITAVLATRTMLNLSTRIVSSTKLYGYKEA